MEDNLREQLEEAEERFLEMRQMYINEKREKEEFVATIKEDTEAEIQRYREDADMHKERARMMQLENGKLLQSILGRDDDNEEGMYSGDDPNREANIIAEQKYLEVMTQRDQSEKSLRQMVNEKNLTKNARPIKIPKHVKVSTFVLNPANNF